jgi:hypothetical protein
MTGQLVFKMREVREKLRAVSCELCFRKAFGHGLSAFKGLNQTAKTQRREEISRRAAKDAEAQRDKR